VEELLARDLREEVTTLTDSSRSASGLTFMVVIKLRKQQKVQTMKKKRTF
jgi:hypothetical protein